MASIRSIITETWRCPHCRHETTVLGIVIDLGDPAVGPLCPECEQPGIHSISERPDLRVVDGRGGQTTSTDANPSTGRAET